MNKGWGSVRKDLAADFDTGKIPQSLFFTFLVSTEVKNGPRLFNNILISLQLAREATIFPGFFWFISGFVRGLTVSVK